MLLWRLRWGLILGLLAWGLILGNCAFWSPTWGVAQERASYCGDPPYVCGGPDSCPTGCVCVGWRSGVGGCQEE